MAKLEAGQYPITRHLPKTGQTTMYQGGDDGAIQNGWWRDRPIATNKTRFISRTLSGDDVVIDRATGLMWPRDFSGDGAFGGLTRTWLQAIGWAAFLNFAGFTDWLLPNAFELTSLCVFEGGPPYVDPIFNNRSTSDYWTSTTRPGLTANAHLVGFFLPNLATFEKTFSFRVIAVRESRL